MRRYKSIAVASVAGFLVIAAATSSIWIQRTLEDKTITVVSKERLPTFSSDGGQPTHENFVYTDNETYVVKDSFWNFHFKSRTVYAKISDAGTCDVTLSGIRFGFLSMSQNIIAADCVAS